MWTIEKRKEGFNVDTLGSLQKPKKQKSKKGLHYELTEKDFYPPEDTRFYQSGVEDIEDGDNFADYAKSFFNLYEDELFDN